jgi:hypothetical protein
MMNDVGSPEPAYAMPRAMHCVIGQVIKNKACDKGPGGVWNINQPPLKGGVKRDRRHRPEQFAGNRISQSHK